MTTDAPPRPESPTAVWLDGFAWLEEAAAEFQARHDVMTIVRIQHLRRTAVLFKNGRLDGVRESEIEGVGVQLFSREGESAIGSSNVVAEDEIRELLDRTLAVLRGSEGKVQGRNKEIWKAEVLRDERILETPFGIDAVGITTLKETLRDHHERMRALGEGRDGELSVTSSGVAIEEEWLIVRGDGTRVRWNVPRFSLGNSFTVRRDGHAASTRSNRHGKDLAQLMDEDRRATAEREAATFCDLAFKLHGTSAIKGGSYKIVIDPALAKGLAHEAFGHAAESDAIRFSSILGAEEKFRQDLKICKDTVSIIDTPIEGDWADSPFSANGLRRRTVKIVDKGVLNEALADIYSAEEIGVAVTGASRLQSYGDIPIPRMSNIRLEIADALDWPHGTDTGPENLHRFLLDNGLMSEDETVLYLVGYRGGQVNPKLGDYVFNCQAIYRFERGETTLHPPAIFAGKVLETLESVVAGIGPLSIHHLGTCGKAGQGVPSSGGGHLFTIIDAHPAIHIGGR